MMLRWNRSACLVLLVIGSLATSATAQLAATPSKQPTQEELASARAHFEAAEAAKARGDYKTAVAEYLAAHELLEDPEFFFDIGVVYQLADNALDALTYYLKYLDLEPSGRGAEAARTAVAELRRAIVAKQRANDDEARRKAVEDARRKADESAAKLGADEARRKAAEDARRKADEDAVKRAADDEARQKQPAISPEVSSAAPAPATRAWYRDPVALALLGTGVATTGVGIGFLFSAQSASQDAKAAKTYQQLLDANNRATQRHALSLVTGGVGIALVGGGMAWAFLHRDSGDQRTVTGWVERGGGGLAITRPF